MRISPQLPNSLPGIDAIFGGLHTVQADLVAIVDLGSSCDSACSVWRNEESPDIGERQISSAGNVSVQSPTCRSEHRFGTQGIELCHVQPAGRVEDRIEPSKSSCSEMPKRR